MHDEMQDISRRFCVIGLNLRKDAKPQRIHKKKFKFFIVISDPTIAAAVNLPSRTSWFSVDLSILQMSDVYSTSAKLLVILALFL